MILEKGETVMTIKMVDKIDNARYKLEGVAAMLEHMAYSVNNNRAEVEHTSNALNMMVATINECNEILNGVSGDIEKELKEE